MNEVDHDEYYDYYDYFEQIDTPVAKKRYIDGYLAEKEAEPRGVTAKMRDAEVDFDAFLSKRADDCYEEGRQIGTEETERFFNEEFRELEKELRRKDHLLSQLDPKKLERLAGENRRLSALVAKAEKDKDCLIGDVLERLDELAPEEDAPCDDVEAWAFSDGQKHVIEQLKDWLNRIATQAGKTVDPL